MQKNRAHGDGQTGIQTDRQEEMQENEQRQYETDLSVVELGLDIKRLQDLQYTLHHSPDHHQTVISFISIITVIITVPFITTITINITPLLHHYLEPTNQPPSTR